ncbi:MAG: DUF3575 domain-containing protein [Candidatus Symbiothrix sp.]|jgi:hypothetical protein|nr:DUF3575 domain-containing protein [Candidatus Symbiothrix sp.]
MKIKNVVLVMLLSLIRAWPGVFAQSHSYLDNSPMVFTFPLGKSELMYDYGGNAEVFERLRSLLALPDVFSRIDSIDVVAAASPIGREDINNSLAFKRSEEMWHYIRRNYPAFPIQRIRTFSIGIDWEGFRSLVEADYGVPNRQELLRYLTSGNYFLLSQYLSLSSPAEHNYLRTYIYPRLQYVYVRLKMTDGNRIYCKENSPIKILVEQSSDYRSAFTSHKYETASVHDTIYTPVHDTIYTTVPDTLWDAKRVKERGNRQALTLALSSNLLYDAVLLPNVSLEVGISDRWSVLVQGLWNWWETSETKQGTDFSSYRFRGVWAEGRYWFNPHNKPLSGWHLGVYGARFDYDFRLFPKEWDSSGYLSRSSYSVGLSGGYSATLSRAFRLDFSLGAGYVTGKQYQYYPAQYSDKFVYRSDKQVHTVLPTQAGVTLVWLISGKPTGKEANK